MREPKLKTVYVCSNCGETSPRWMGRCPSCGSWGSMVEEFVTPPAAVGGSKGAPRGLARSSRIVEDRPSEG